MKNTFTTALLTSAAVFFAGQALAQSQGDWTFGIGVANVGPKSETGTLAGQPTAIGSDNSITLTAEYFIRDNLGIELLAAMPFEHDITIEGVGGARPKHLPPTLSLTYHFPTQNAFKTYVGVGIHYTTFYEEKTALGSLDLDDSVGFSVQAGLDYQFSETGAIRFNLRGFDIDTDATLDGTPIETAEIDPILIGVAYVHRF